MAKVQLITLKKLPRDAATAATEHENREDKPENGWQQKEHAATDAATNEDAATDAATENRRFYEESGSSGNSGSRFGGFSDASPGSSDSPDSSTPLEAERAAQLREYLKDPPQWWVDQAERCIQQGSPKRLVHPLANSTALDCLKDTFKWREALPLVAAKLEEMQA